MESDNGRSSARGVHHGKNRKGAEGPMQFEPATSADIAVPSQPLRTQPQPVQPAGRDLQCRPDAVRRRRPGWLARGHRAAVFAYNHAGWYVRAVLSWAARYAAAAAAAARSGGKRHRGKPGWVHGF